MQSLKKIFPPLFISLITLLSLASLILFIVYTDALYLNEVKLKEGVFDISGKLFEFNMKNMGNGNYDLQMACYHPKLSPPGYASFQHRILWENTYLSANIELMDSVGTILKKVTLAPDRETKIRASGFYREGFDFQLFNFDTRRGEKYKLRIVFNDQEQILDKISKDIFVVTHHDPASMPWIAVFQVGFLVVFILSTAVLWKTWLNWHRKKHQ